MKRIALLLAACCLLCSCSNEKARNKALLSSAAGMMDTKLEESVSKLNAVNPNMLSNSDYHYYNLLVSRASDMGGSGTAGYEQAAIAAKDYFISERNYDKSAFACFVLGRIYDLQGKFELALYCYLQADDWAEKAANNIEHFDYARIPYNIAALYKLDGKYQEALSYLEKVQAHADMGSGYPLNMHTYTLKGNCHMLQGEFNSALQSLQKALEVADAHNDTTERGRILYNISLLAYYTNDYAKAIGEYEAMLAQHSVATDSLCVGLVQVALSKMYGELNDAEKARLYIYRAKEYLKNAEYYAKVALYEVLITIEKNAGNSKKAEEYQAEYDQVLQDREQQKQAEAAIIIQQKSELNDKLASLVLKTVAASRSDYKMLTLAIQLGLGLLVAVLVGFAIVLYRVRRKQQAVLRALCKEELFLTIAQQQNLEQVSNTLSLIGNIEQRQDAQTHVEVLQGIYEMLPLTTEVYGQLYARLQRQFPKLTETELRVCWIAHTRLIEMNEIRRFINLDAKTFMMVWDSMTYKIKEANRSLRVINGLLVRYSLDND